MARKLAALVAVAFVVAATAAVAQSGSVATKQRIAIQGDNDKTFVLKPLGAGALKGDSGAADFCCWKSIDVMRDGQKIEIAKDQKLTLVGKRGTLAAVNRLEWIPVGPYGLATGTWRIVSGTGAYAGMAGGGRLVALLLPNKQARWRFEGLVGPK